MYSSFGVGVFGVVCVVCVVCGVGCVVWGFRRKAYVMPSGVLGASTTIMKLKRPKARECKSCGV